MPTAETSPDSMMLAAVTLPVAETPLEALRFCAVMLPDALILPVADRLPPLILEVTTKLPSVPRAVRELVVTLELSVLPTRLAALAVLVTPVS